MEYPLYYVKWVDHFHDTHAWTPINEITEEDIDSTCESVGFKIFEDDTWITLALTVCSVGNCLQTMWILKSTIVKKKVLK